MVKKMDATKTAPTGKPKKKRSSKAFGVLQRVGRSFMLPIALLPIAGLLLGIGSSLTNQTMLEAYGLVGILGKILSENISACQNIAEIFTFPKIEAYLSTVKS